MSLSYVPYVSGEGGGGGGGTGIQNKKKIRAHNFSYHHNVLAKIFSNVARVSLSRSVL